MPDQVSREAKKRHVAVSMVFFSSSFLVCLCHDSNAVVEGGHKQRLDD